MTSTAMNREDERTNKGAAYIGTIVFHAAILLFLILFKIITPIPPYPHVTPPSVEVALDFGNNVNGSGNVEAPNKGNNPAPTNNNNNTQTSQPNPPPNSVVTNNTENNPSMNNAKHSGKVDKIDTVKTEPQHVSVDLAAAENKFKHSKGQTGGNGNTSETGNAGNPNGTNPGVGNGTDPNGKDYFLTGRNLISHPIPVNVSQDQGKVVVEITVDPDGNVIKAVPGAKGSTTSSAYLYRLAKQSALATKFSKSSDPNTPQQQGTMTVVFVIQ